MRAFTIVVAVVLEAIAGMILLSAFPAHAQSSDTWVSGSGVNFVDGNANNCANPAAPCRQISFALEQTSSGGTVHVLPGSYSALTITSAVEIIADQGQAAIVGPGFSGPPGTGNYGIVVRPDAGDVVRIRGIIINSSSGSQRGGIYFQSGAALYVEDCTLVRNNTFPALNIAPTTSANVTVRNTVMSLNGGGNVQVKPSNNALVVATFVNVLFANGAYGLRADNSGGSGKIIVDVKNSVAKGNANNGYLAVGTGANPVHFMIDRSTAESNGVYGAVATGPQAFMIVGNSTLMSNGTGLAQLNGATVASYGTNQVNFNTTNTAGTITAIAQR